MDSLDQARKLEFVFLKFYTKSFKEVYMLFLNLSHTRGSKVGLIKKCLNPILRRFFPQLLLIVVSFFGSDKNFNLRLVGGLEKNNIHCSLSLDSWNSS